MLRKPQSHGSQRGLSWPSLLKPKNLFTNLGDSEFSGNIYKTAEFASHVQLEVSLWDTGVLAYAKDW